MAACYEKLNKYEEMADAARGCIKADRTFVKGYFRLATAYKHLNELNECVKALESGLNVDSTNKDLKQMKKDVMELQRAETVAGYCGTAEQQFRSGDVYAAYKTLEAAKRLDAGNADVVKLEGKILPAYEKAEAKRKKGMTGSALFKEKGDDLYKNANFEGAIEQYTKCIESCKKEGKGESELIMKAYSNRAACYKQVSECVLYLLSLSLVLCFTFFEQHSHFSLCRLATLTASLRTARLCWRPNPTMSRRSFDAPRPLRVWNATDLRCRIAKLFS